MREIKLLKWMLPFALLLSIGVSARAGITPESVREHEDFSRSLALAEQGDIKAELCVAEMYFTGWGTPRDLDRALAWNTKAAASGNQDGESAIGDAYLFGYGVFQDAKHAQEIFHGLINRGYTPAISSLGMMYENGVGVPRDPKRAFTLYEQAALKGDGNAEWHLGMMYKNGMGVKANTLLAQQWLNKLPQHKSKCMPDFQSLSSMIIFGNIIAPKGKSEGKSSGKPMVIRFKYDNGKAQDIRIIQSSGYPKWDAALLQAVQNSRFPPWPVGYENLDKTNTSYFYKENRQWKKSPGFKLFSKSLASAILHSVVMPKHVLFYGSKGTDITTVSFEYLDGKVGNVKVVKSSGDKYEDAEAIHAVKAAKYPPVPNVYEGRSIRFTIPIKFNPFSPAPNPGTRKVSGSVLIH